MISLLLLVNRQGKVRLIKWYLPFEQKEKKRFVKEISSMVIGRPSKRCNFLEWKEFKLIYKRYASLYFIATIEKVDNELLMLEVIHHFVELLDRYFGNVCELDIIFNFNKAYYILEQMLIAGHMVESSKRQVLKAVTTNDNIMEEEKEEPVRR